MIFPSKSEYVLKIVKDRILDGTYAQGANITISKVANELGVSIIPVREAIKRLESEGLIEIHPNKGAKVIEIDRKQVNEIGRARAVLEGYAGASAIAYITQEDIDLLRYYNEKMMQYYYQGDDVHYSQMNKEFHRHIYRKCPYEKINELIVNLWDGTGYTKSVFAYFPDKMKTSCEEHEEIIQAIENKQPDRVEFLLREHRFTTIVLLGSSRK